MLGGARWLNTVESIPIWHASLHVLQTSLECDFEVRPQMIVVLTFVVDSDVGGVGRSAAPDDIELESVPVRARLGPAG